MNRLILVGNGFDLAHGLKTDYNSFIVWYLKKCFSHAFGYGEYVDDLIRVYRKTGNIYLDLPEIDTIDEMIDYFYESGFMVLKNEWINIEGYNQKFQNPLCLVINSSLMLSLLQNCHSKNWVDIENEFYELLKTCNTLRGVDNDALKKLNSSLKTIIEQLDEYLSSLSNPTSSSAYSKIFSSNIEKDEILGHDASIFERPENTMVLNFNYTNTAEQYGKYRSNLPSPIRNIVVNYIHGQIGDAENPLIFGFGDELDDYYHKMELTKTNQFFTYIKSFWYFKTSNYHDLIRFIEDGNYQIFTLGHSCGLSDRTLLSMIFEHQNCKAIKIYYHGDKEKNDYRKLTQEISRHFKDKSAMRKKITPFDKSFPMPQVPQ